MAGTATATDAGTAAGLTAGRFSALYDRLETPIGEILMLSDGESLTGLHFMTAERDALIAAGRWRRAARELSAASLQLRRYFAGELRVFDLPLAPAGTRFQRDVWAALRQIPYGATTTYGELAARIGRPAAARAVGAANAGNPISVIIPCHRVIASGGELTGYSGGLDRKRLLLEHEGALPPARSGGRRAAGAR